MKVIHKKNCIISIIIVALLTGTVIFAGVLQKRARDAVQTVSSEVLMNRHKVEYIAAELIRDYLEDRQEQLMEEAQKRDEWQMVLVNKWNPLGEDYDVRRTEVDNYQYVDVRIADALNEMLSDAEEEGITIRVISGYRSYKRQVSLYNNKVKRLKRKGYTEEEAVPEAGAVVAVPGTSEHMTGLAVDLVDASNTRLEEDQEHTAGYQWLKEHCAEYGFIVRYPNGKSNITGIIYEPWHFRYVGKANAEVIMEKGWCLEEFLKEYPTFESRYELHGRKYLDE